MGNIYHAISHYLVNMFGFEKVAQIEDSLVFISGFYIGGVIMFLFLSSLSKNTISDLDLSKKLSAIKVEKKTDHTIIVRPWGSGILASLDITIGLVLLKFKKNKFISISDVRSAKVLLYIILFIGLMFVLAALTISMNTLTS